MWNKGRKSGAPSSQSANESDSQADENGLLHLVGTGDLHAFELLYRRYFPRLVRFLDRLIRRPNLIEEIVNDTMLVVWGKANSFDGSCKLSTWIFAIAYRKAMKAVQWQEPVDHDFDMTPDEAGLEPAELVQLHELKAQLHKAIDALPFDQRTVVCLTYFHDLGYAEIADIMECPVNTVKTRMYHARRKLEAMLVH
jgi:RNA polymerase sigma factor (sigma-70 family)